MIDKIEIQLFDFSSYGKILLDKISNKYKEVDPSFPPAFMKRGTVFSGYRVINDKLNHSLIINYVKGEDKLTLEGSIRKWYLGAGSLSDLNQKSFENALKRLAEKLDIPYLNLLEASIMSVEIGYTFKISDRIEGVIPRMVKYSTFKRYGSDSSIGFTGKERILRVYDQVKEKRENGFKRIGNLIAKKSNVQYLRIEMGLRNYKAIYEKFRVLKLKGILKKFYDFVYYLNEEIGKMIMIEDTLPDLNTLSIERMPMLKKFIYKKGLYAVGIENAMSAIKKINDSKGNISKYRKEMMQDLLNGLESPMYTVSKFRDELKRNLEDYLCKYSDHPAIVLYFT